MKNILVSGCKPTILYCRTWDWEKVQLAFDYHRKKYIFVSRYRTTAWDLEIRLRKIFQSDSILTEKKIGYSTLYTMVN